MHIPRASTTARTLQPPSDTLLTPGDRHIPREASITGSATHPHSRMHALHPHRKPCSNQDICISQQRRASREAHYTLTHECVLVLVLTDGGSAPPRIQEEAVRTENSPPAHLTRASICKINSIPKSPQTPQRGTPGIHSTTPESRPAADGAQTQSIINPFNTSLALFTVPLAPGYHAQLYRGGWAQGSSEGFLFCRDGEKALEEPTMGLLLPPISNPRGLKFPSVLQSPHGKLPLRPASCPFYHGMKSHSRHRSLVRAAHADISTCSCSFHPAVNWHYSALYCQGM